MSSSEGASSQWRPWSCSGSIKRPKTPCHAAGSKAKIKSGDLLAVVEVVRDLYRSREQAEPSYSECTLYEIAVETLVREVATAHSHARTEAQKLIEQSHANVPRLKEAKPAVGMDREEDEGEAA